MSVVIRSAPVDLSARAAAIAESATLRVTRRAAELRARGVRVVDLGAGEPDFPSPAVAVEAARQALADGFTRYTPGSGIPELRAAIAESYRERYGAPWQASDSVITVGGKAALFELALALFEGGQEVIVPSPCWVSFPEQIRFAGALPVTVPAKVGDSFRIHPGPLLEAVTSRTTCRRSATSCSLRQVSVARPVGRESIRMQCPGSRDSTTETTVSTTRPANRALSSGVMPGPPLGA